MELEGHVRTQFQSLMSKGSSSFLPKPEPDCLKVESKYFSQLRSVTACEFYATSCRCSACLCLPRLETRSKWVIDPTPSNNIQRKSSFPIRASHKNPLLICPNYIWSFIQYHASKYQARNSTSPRRLARPRALYRLHPATAPSQLWGILPSTTNMRWNETPYLRHVQRCSGGTKPSHFPDR